jgi:alkyl sulfatase BDS1-like metallo-beta-lactamase superfamily hydrolase
VYDEPEFVVRNTWRLYGGWWDGNPAHLKPAAEGELAGELASLAGGAGRLMERAKELADGGNYRLACHLAEYAWQAAPGDEGMAAARAQIYRQRAGIEASTMSKGIYSAAGEKTAAAEK